MATTEKSNFTGGCHCGYARYTVAVALASPPTATRCNCTICLKSGWTSVALESSEDFKLHQPASFGDLLDYQVNSPEIHRLVCPKCGIHIYGYGRYRIGDQNVDFRSINLLTIDQPQDGIDLSQFKMEYWDGRKNNWQSGKKDTPWPGGTV